MALATAGREAGLFPAGIKRLFKSEFPRKAFSRMPVFFPGLLLTQSQRYAYPAGKIHQHGAIMAGVMRAPAIFTPAAATAPAMRENNPGSSAVKIVNSVMRLAASGRKSINSGASPRRNFAHNSACHNGCHYQNQSNRQVAIAVHACKFAIGPAGQHGPGFALGFIGIAKRDRRRVGTAQYRVTAMIQITHQCGFPPIPDIWPHSTNIRHGQTSNNFNRSGDCTMAAKS
ncbi:MAG: hypothetical protein CM15mP46_0680 [Alphaproteobacteria bacterium]|nr:MAG: hypothetical protein CM15mP46_0680 [Alphaproteobacteria bacterium]